VIHDHEKSRLRHPFDSLNFIIFLLYDMVAVMIAVVQCLGLCWEDTTVCWIMNSNTRHTFCSFSPRDFTLISASTVGMIYMMVSDLDCRLNATRAEPHNLNPHRAQKRRDKKWFFFRVWCKTP
jgi:hypothetical protein